jgi:hypothetical protein
MKSQSQYLVDAIRKLKPSSEFVIRDGDYSTIEWHVLEGTAPTQAELDAAIKQVKIDDANADKSRLDARNALLAKLGITSDELSILLG